MSRVSTAEMYDDKDVITQICKLKDGLNSALGGIIADIGIVNDELVIDWADGESISLPLPNPTGISSIAGSVSGGNLTMTIYMTDGSSHAFTCPLTGFVTLDTAQTIAATKTFLSSPNVPTIPAVDDSAVNSFYVNDSTGTVENNLLHKDGNEIKNGILTISNANGNLNVEATTGNVGIVSRTMKGNMGPEYTLLSNLNQQIYFRDGNSNNIGQIFVQHTTSRNSNAIIEVNNRIQGDNEIIDTRNDIRVVVSSTGERRIASSFDQRDFSPNNTKDIVTVNSLIQALRYYELIP